MSRQIIYSTRRVANMEGRTLKNPRYFSGPVKGATKVYINGDWPQVRKAYEAEGVSVSDVSEMRAMPGKAKAETAS